MNWRHLLVSSFLFERDQAAGTVARKTPLWQAWIQERFPLPSVQPTPDEDRVMRASVRQPDGV